MLPVKLLDYATLGIPVIAARLRTVEYYFGDGAVELFEPGNVTDLAHAIRLLYKNPDLRARLVERARACTGRSELAKPAKRILSGNRLVSHRGLPGREKSCKSKRLNTERV